MRSWLGLAAVLCAFPSTSVFAELCAVDNPPAATLLLPYFEVDTIREDGTTTLFSVVNVVAEPTLVKVVLWSDLGLPSIDFDVYLTGFDVFSVNLRDLFVGGRLPGTGEEISPRGFDSFPNGPFPGCSGSFGGEIGESSRRALVNFHLGRPSLLIENLCAAAPRVDGIVRGYATIDVVRRCASQTPTDDGYFGPEGVASYDNRIIGDAFFVDPANDFAQGENLVHLEASPDEFGPGDRTFYAPFVAADGSDGREPLPTVWASRMLEGGGFDGGTELTVWRGLPAPREPFACGGELPLLPLINQVYSFDEEENGLLVFPSTFIVDPPPPRAELDPVPFATNRIQRDDFFFFQPASFGWLSMDLSTWTYERSSRDRLAQAWLGTTFNASGKFSVGMDASPLNSACSLQGCTIGEAVEVGELCVLGVPSSGTPTGPLSINPGEPLEFLLRPKGCFSSSCTMAYRLDCFAGRLEGTTLPIVPKMCLSQNRQEGVSCTADCSEQFQAYCGASEGLPEGTFTITAGDLELTLEVPSNVPLGGKCVSASTP